MFESNARIDPLLVSVVNKLNRSGLTTVFSCQGNHEYPDPPKIAYICFAPKVQIPNRIKSAVAEYGWELDKLHITQDTNNHCYAIYSVLSDFEFDADELRNRNDIFIEGWTKILSL